MSSPFKSPEVCVVEASAGSGKTYALAKRYIQLLLYSSSQSPLGLKNILAITFTNKSAAEMKSRILDFLKRIALGQLSESEMRDIVAPLKMTPKQSQDAAIVLMGELIRHYHFFQVQTIDSFMNTLLSGCAFRINLSAKFKIKRNASDYLQQSLDQLVDLSHTNKDIKVLFEAFIRQYLFLENRSGWFPKKDLFATMSVLFNQRNTYQMPFLTYDLSSADIVEQKKKFLKLAVEMHSILPVATDKRFRDALEGFIAEHPDGFDVDSVSRYFSREEFPVNKGGEVLEQLNELWQLSRSTLRGICLREAYAVFNPYVRLFDELMLRLNVLQAKEDVLFLQQLNQKTASLFDDGLVTVEELYYRLATRFNHYLIDEFQDTSAAQWNNLRLMAEESLSTGGSLFYVGDKKQAIYSFRGGKSALFDELQEDFAHFNVTREILSKNYRSNRAIVEFNNRIFSLENLKSFILDVSEQSRLKTKEIAFGDDDFIKLEQIFGSAQQTWRGDLPNGVVCVTVIPGQKKQERHEIIRAKLVTLVREAHARFDYRDIAVLTRNNMEVQLVTQWLMAEGISAQSERTSDIKNHPLIRELAAYLRFLHSPIDNVSFAEFISGDLFGAVSGLSKLEIRDFLFRCRIERKTTKEQYLYRSFRLSFPKIWENYFEDFFRQAGIYPLYELAVSICGRLNCTENFPDAQGFFMHFLELIKRREEDSCDLETFMEYFDNLEDEDRFVPMPAQDAVQVTTVHKSKGLEFAVVILPFLEMSIKVGTTDKDGGQSFIWDVEDEGMRLLRLKESYARFSSELRDRYAWEYKQAFFAELNNVYVALTRASWEMYILIPEKAGNSTNPLLSLIPEDMYLTGAAAASAHVSKAASPRRMLPPIKYQQWINRLQEEFIRESSDQTKARVEGEILHFCLSLLGNLTNVDLDQAIACATQKASLRFTQKSQWQPYQSKLNALLKDAQWQKFFFLPSNAQILCEQEIVNHFGDTRRIDRLVIFPDEIWIVDFKSSRIDQAAHEEQIKEYATLISKIYPKHKILTTLLYSDEGAHG